MNIGIHKDKSVTDGIKHFKRRSLKHQELPHDKAMERLKLFREIINFDKTKLKKRNALMEEIRNFDKRVLNHTMPYVLDIHELLNEIRTFNKGLMKLSGEPRNVRKTLEEIRSFKLTNLNKVFKTQISNKKALFRDIIEFDHSKLIKRTKLLREIRYFSRRNLSAVITRNKFLVSHMNRSKMLFGICIFEKDCLNRVYSNQKRNFQQLLQEIRSFKKKRDLKFTRTTNFSQLLQNIRGFNKSKLRNWSKHLHDIREFDSSNLKHCETRISKEYFQRCCLIIQIPEFFIVSNLICDFNVDVMPRNRTQLMQDIRAKHGAKPVRVTKIKNFQQLLQDIRGFDKKKLRSMKNFFAQIRNFNDYILHHIELSEIRMDRYLNRAKLLNEITSPHNIWWLDAIEPCKNYQDMLQDIRTFKFSGRKLNHVNTFSVSKIKSEIIHFNRKRLRPYNAVMKEIKEFGEHYELVKCKRTYENRYMTRVFLLSNICNVRRNSLKKINSVIKSNLGRSKMLYEISHRKIHKIVLYKIPKTKNIQAMLQEIRCFKKSSLCTGFYTKNRPQMLSDIRCRVANLDHVLTTNKQELFKQIRGKVWLIKRETLGDQIKNFDRSKLKKTITFDFHKLCEEIRNFDHSKLIKRNDLMHDIRYFDKNRLYSSLPEEHTNLARERLMMGIRKFDQHKLHHSPCKNRKNLLQDIRHIQFLH